jgi:hypothetical protein
MTGGKIVLDDKAIADEAALRTVYPQVSKPR